MQLLLDTNVVIEHLRSPKMGSLFNDVDLYISVITEIELFRYPGLGKDEIDLIERFLIIVRSIPVTSSLARYAARIGRTRKIRVPDLLIAATAIQLGVPLYTKNKKDFRNIPDLVLYKA